VKQGLAALAVGAAVLMPQSTEARVYNDHDHRPCVSRSEWRQLAYFNGVRRRIIEERFEVTPLPVDANIYVDPANPHLYPIAYRVCGYDPYTEQVVVVNYRSTSNAWWWAFRLNLTVDLPAPHTHPRSKG